MFSVEFIFRIIGMVIVALLGWSFGGWAARIEPFDPRQEILYRTVFGLVGAMAGLVLTPYLTTRPARAIRRALGRLSAETLFAGLTGLIVGLLTAALLAYPFSQLPPPFGEILPFVGVIAFSYFGVALFVMRQGDLMGLMSQVSGRTESGSSSAWTNLNRTILLDTSVIIDGRVADIAKTGFLPGTLLIPRFVLNELQYIADSPDGLRRQRGRRGMEVLADLQKLPNILVRISDIDAEGVREVDDKLVVLARQLKCPILTNDYNLNRVADIARTGFLPGTLLIPRFVLNELQYIADSPDGLRRQRGRRGMEVLADLQKLPNILVRISDIDAEGVREVDDKLVVLARQLKCPILTNDYNLNRVAELQGVTILNINELANAVKSVVLPSEHLTLNIFQEGKEFGQGVGYMDDGTMVVVENGHDYIGEYKEVVVTKVLQTAAGRMVFARVEDENGKKKK